jgi:hypothetical protein
MIDEDDRLLRGAMLQDVVVLHSDDTVMHWLVHPRGEIITYNVRTMEQGTIVLPLPLSPTSKEESSTWGHTTHVTAGSC